MGAQYVDTLEKTVEKQSQQLDLVQVVISNLEKTIGGKQDLLDDMNHYSGSTNRVMEEYLRININELQRILADLRKAVVTENTQGGQTC